MIVVGGTYTESVVFPSQSSVLVGSGVRAAAVLGGDVTKLVTVATAPEAETVRATVDARTTVEVIGRERPVEFQYLDPALSPEADGLPTAPFDGFACSVPDEKVLAFGLAEMPSGYPITARQVVFDPQSPRAATAAMLDAVSADRIAVCANRAEATLMTGLASPIDAAEALHARPQVDAVVVKCGPLGYVTADDTGTVWRHASPSLTVSTLGSGDVFSSIFAREWFAGASTADAAAAASRAVAESAGQRGPGASDIVLPMSPGYAPRVYLAGPFFTISERWLVDRVRAVLRGLGARVFSPIHDVGPGDIEVAKKDLLGLDESDVVFALLDGFDPGTIYETGWAARESIPVVGFSSEVHAKQTKMLVGMGAEVHTDLTSALFRAIWAGQGLTLTPGIHGA